MMGMFDYLEIEADVPGIEQPASIRWQTKAFDMPALDCYRITRDGRLLHQRNPLVDDGTDPNCVGWDEIDYHGDVEFIGELPGFPRFVARFTHSKLEWIQPAAPTRSAP